jgi:DNA ligase 1
MKPMLAAAVTDTTALRWPLVASRKLDGVRCIIIDGIAMSRTLKPIPNEYVQDLFGRKSMEGLDGELIVDEPYLTDVYRRTVSGVMKRSGKPDVTFWAFDNYRAPGGFTDRFEKVKKTVEGLDQNVDNHHVNLVEHYQVTSFGTLDTMEADFLQEGYEGVMLRHPDGPYKYGRSTEREQWLLKLKRFQDGEAEVVGLTELERNGNEAKRNALGHLERSSHKANKVAGGVLGKLTVTDTKSGVTFDIGTGFTMEDRLDFWLQGKKLVGRLVKYKFQPVGVKDKPRFPVFIGWRDRRDV